MKRYQITFFGAEEQPDVFFMYGLLVSASKDNRGCFDIVIVRSSSAPMVDGTDVPMLVKASSEIEALNLVLGKIKAIPSLDVLGRYEMELPEPSPSLKDALSTIV